MWKDFLLIAQCANDAQPTNVLGASANLYRDLLTIALANDFHGSFAVKTF
jgi:hypothetical protein